MQNEGRNKKRKKGKMFPKTREKENQLCRMKGMYMTVLWFGLKKKIYHTAEYGRRWTEEIEIERKRKKEM